jgi:release factor glutamine methyltransferase
VANLPYVRSGELVDVMPEVRDHEPYVALDGGADGLDVIRRFAQEAQGTPWIALEVGEGMTDAVAKMLRAAGWSRIRVEPDLAGLGRVVVGQA